jgi:hypothetical protein
MWSPFLSMSQDFPATLCEFVEGSTNRPAREHFARPLCKLLAAYAWKVALLTLVSSRDALALEIVVNIGLCEAILAAHTIPGKLAPIGEAPDGDDINFQ